MLCCVCAAGNVSPAQARTAAAVVMRHATSLDRTPGGVRIATIPARDGFSEPTRLPVLASTYAHGGVWVRVRIASKIGWLAATRAATPEPPPPMGLRHALRRILAGTSGGAGVLITAVDGTPLFGLHPDAPRILASNTKLFTTAAALARFGARVVLPLVMAILPNSDNALAQQLSDRLGSGSAARGARRARQYACSLGACASLADGSGLSPANRASPRAVANLLVQMRLTPRFRGWLRAFPVAGVSGTLANRLQGAARGRCEAKTGTLIYPLVSALSGYCHAQHGRVLVFSVLLSGDIAAARDLQDRIVNSLVRLG